MSNTQPAPVEPGRRQTAVSNPIGSPRHFVLACIGLLSLLIDEVPALLEQSVQRGNLVLERAQTEAKRNRRQAPPRHVSHELQHELTQRGLPTRDDYNTLLQQLTALEQEIDRILAQRAASQ